MGHVSFHCQKESVLDGGWLEEEWQKIYINKKKRKRKKEVFNFWINFLKILTKSSLSPNIPTYSGQLYLFTFA